MSHAWFHAQSSARRFGGEPEDYMPVHDWLDATKETFADARHRALRHHSQGIFEAERVIGKKIRNSQGKEIPVRLIAEQHVQEDVGFIPTVADWLSGIPWVGWMNLGYRKAGAVERGEIEAPTPRARDEAAMASCSPARRSLQQRRHRSTAPLDL